MKDGHYYDELGREIWYKNGKVHREDGPAVTWTDGSQFWYQNGEYHREDGPAILYQNGIKEWWLEGDEYHNEVLWMIEIQKMKRQEKRKNNII